MPNIRLLHPAKSTCLSTMSDHIESAVVVELTGNGPLVVIYLQEEMVEKL